MPITKLDGLGAWEKKLELGPVIKLPKASRSQGLGLAGKDASVGSGVS